MHQFPYYLIVGTSVCIVYMGQVDGQACTHVDGLMHAPNLCVFGVDGLMHRLPWPRITRTSLQA